MSTPEEASEYLSRTNFKSVIEWITAEAILNRPSDPTTFVKGLLEQKIASRGNLGYAAEQVTALSHTHLLCVSCTHTHTHSLFHS